MKITTLLLAAALTCSLPNAYAQSGHTMIAPDKLQWMDGPKSLPAGAKMAVLSGDPGGPGLFTVRLKVPAGYVVQAHWHPTDEHITVISGVFKMGMGDKFDRNNLTMMRPGGYAVMPAKNSHYAAADVDCIIQVHGMGPFEITYIDPANDPRNK